MKNFFCVSSLLVLITLTGCAGYKILPVDLLEKKQEGLRFYRPQPYLVVSDAPLSAQEKQAGEGSHLAYEVIYLPDYNNGYVVQRRSGLGTADATVTLTNGWMLSVLGLKTDSQIPQTLEAVSKLIPTVLGAPGKNKLVEGAPMIAHGLYRINIAPDNSVKLELIKAN